MGGRVPEPDYLVVGHLAKAHGTRGELVVRALTDWPEEVFVPGATVVLGDEQGGTGAGDERRLETVRRHKSGWLVGLVGVDDRTAARELAGRYLLVPADRLREPEEGEYFYHQLLGLEVETVEGVALGRVREVFETEPRHLLEVKGAGRVHLIPFDRRIVRSVELEAGRLVVDPPDGLLDL